MKGRGAVSEAGAMTSAKETQKMMLTLLTIWIYYFNKSLSIFLVLTF